MDDRQLERLRWNSRRGLLELDLILTRFMASKLEKLTPEQLAAYAEILRMPDNDFLDVVMQRKDCTQPHLEEIFGMIKDA